MSTEQIIADAVGLSDMEKVELIAKLEETLHLPAEIDLALRREAIARLDDFRKSVAKQSSAETIDDFTQIK